MSGPGRRARWARLEALFHRAVELDPEGRRAFLEEHLPDHSSADEHFRGERSADPHGLQDSELRRELEELLACDSRSTAWQGLDLGPAASSTPRIPGYEDLELAGHGGMGSVYRARRSDALFDGRVFAIKVLHAHRLDEHCRRRFHVERRLLASLDHPNIVRLYGGGVLDDGRPFLVMDHVEGEPLDLYCRQRRLSVEDRLRLFRDLCGALQHAHQCLVVHRDLKPANVRVDADGVPHLLDFGIAKLLHEDAPATTTRLVPMTPGYASPEQVAGRRVTTASDIYSAGLLLFEVLTGRLPPPVGPGSPYTEPPLISSMVGGEITGGSGSRRDEVRQWQRRLRGDLDHIVAKCLRWRPEDRYASARELADDLDRHLRHLPVKARQGGWRYASGRFARRHRGALVAVFLFGTTTSFAGLTALQSWRLRAQASESVRLIRQLAGPDESRLMASGSLDRTVDGILALDEPTEAKTLLLTLVNRLNLPAEQVTEGAIELFETQLREGRADRSSAELARLLGEMLFHGGRNGASERVLAQSIRILESVPDARAVELPAHLEMRARVLAELERFDEGEALLRRSLATRSTNGQDEPGLARGQSQLSSLLFLQGRYAEAADAGHAALESLGRNGGGAALHRAEMHTGLAVALIELDPFDPEAEAHAREALRIALGELGPGHMVTLQARYNLATVLARSDRLPEALAITEENLRAAEASLGPSHSRVAYILTGLAKAYQTMGQPRRCASHARRAVTLRSEALGAASWRTAVSKTRLASCLAELGRAREAKELLEASIRVFESSEVEDDKHLLEARAQLAGLRAAERSS